ncbi:sulfite exporter TauE/SafE family protein [Pontibacter sp. G13]|uniref:sulfite exporter TauE/SafE family protein n=1 Tax=Pontibacter sp. G13 TaxID=3074898 RepID=UPI00288944F3|nr:sulfite exporter TauE/SafE family protein [Pontibacter sp. G13]WNJ19461.1 sulfite exporter TauE/SafE family protein [Pontibacter sp. G13]
MNLAFENPLDPMGWLIFVVAGIGTGVINTLAGSGSLVTLPIFMYVCGLPASVANGTNRVGVFLQSLVGVAGFKKAGNLPTEGLVWILVPSALGATLGSLIAVDLNEEIMHYAIGGLMVFMLGVLLLNPKRWIRESTFDPAKVKHPLTIGLMFLIGIYGGFLQAGVGIMLLAGLVLRAGFNLASANAVKLLAVIAFCIPALLTFWYNGQVNWLLGFLMAIFQSIGAVIGVRFVSRVPNADQWIHRLLIVVVAAAALKQFGVFG